MSRSRVGDTPARSTRTARKNYAKPYSTRERETPRQSFSREKLMKTENNEKAAYQILGKWHIHRGVILYIVTLPDALELILSSGVAMILNAKQAMKIPCLLPQLAQLIADGADLPMIEFTVRACPRMLPHLGEGGGAAPATTPASGVAASGTTRNSTAPPVGAKSPDHAAPSACQPLPPPFPRSGLGGGGGAALGR